MKINEKEAGDGPLKMSTFAGNKQNTSGHDGGLVVNVPAFYSDYLTSNPAEVCDMYQVKWIENK